ncbi:MAG TPA: hypothetical protein VE377_04660 [Candidatus Dormibacteraeota bacterium]|nr:hypothetical protein [Candidatus Dormibacteraeota bacterium]
MKPFAKRFLTHGLPLFVLFGAAHSQSGGKKLVIGRDNLCVTEGAIDNAANARLSINVPKMRAYVNTWTSQNVEAHFTYLGPTAQESRLGSGQIRRQFGLKLRAQDPCNLVYAMWRIEPESKLVVSVKRNPSQHTSAECGNRGYQNIKPRHSSAVPMLRPGDSHTLRAEMRGDDLRVFADDTEVWEGTVAPDAAGLEGPVGMRSDNAHLELDLKVGEYVGVHPNYVITCKSGAEASE